MVSHDESNVTVSYKDSSIQVVEARCLGVPHRTRRQLEICDVAGRIVGEISLMPPIYIQDKISQMRAAGSLSITHRYEKLKEASQIYKKETLAGLNPQAYVNLVANVTGLQEIVITNSLANIAYSLNNMSEILKCATPTGAVWDWNDPRVKAGCSLFSRRGDVVSIITSGNGPGVHGFWPQAIALGYRTIVKPSSREPFTAQRLVHALELAGLAEYVALIPADHEGTENLITESDLAIVYGGADVAARYSRNHRVHVQGPGRSKIVVGKDVRHEEAVTIAANSVLSLGGAACVSTSAILVEDDYIGFAQKLRQELKIQSQDYPLTLGRQQEVDIYEKLLKFDNEPWVYDRSFSMGYPLTPHLNVVESAQDAKVQRELPFPCVTVAPFNVQNDYEVLSNSLVVTVLSRQQDMITKLARDASIANIYVGKIPTTWMDFRIPHDGYLADFLMCNRGIRIEEQWLQNTEIA
jgi:hypothetical protein